MILFGMHNSKSKLVFATNNKHKLHEVSHLLSAKFKLLSLSDINCFDEIPEDFFTLEENASQKAWFIFNKYNINCFADDTGLEVDSLNGEPGVMSARYAGESKDPSKNILKLLANLKGETNRTARFRTVISLIIEGKEYHFEGVVNGKIIDTPQGSDGFGYDPVFVPDGHSQTFAEMDLSLKNSISHRAIAVEKLVDFLASF